MVDLILLRGLPGTGKSTFAESLVGFCVACADDFFMKGGQYVFDPTLLPAAHQDCLDRTRENLSAGKNVVVANVFSMRWEFQPYLDLAQEIRNSGRTVRLIVTDLYDAGLTDAQLAQRNSHGVPESVIASMRCWWEHDWKNGSPVRPSR